MKLAIIIIVLVLATLLALSEARMSIFACADCYAYDEGPFCITNGSVVCNNCFRDKMLCADYTLSSERCSSPCDPKTGLDDSLEFQ